MLKLTQELKSWLVTQNKCVATASDLEFRKAAGEALVDGTLTTENYGSLTKDAKTEEVNQFSNRLNAIADGLEKLTVLLTPKEVVVEEKSVETITKEKAIKPEEKAEKPEEKAGKPITKMMKMLSMGGSSEDGEKDVDIRVKEAIEMYSAGNKSAMIYPNQTKNGNGHPFAGQPVKDYTSGGRTLETPSDRDKAIVGAWGKFLCAIAQKRSKTLAWMGLPEHDKEIILYALHNEKWCGNIGDDPSSEAANYANVIDRKLTPHEQKGLIDDSTSGGTEAVPIVFDDMLISTPILYGELFPLVNLIPLDRGRRIQGARAGIVSSEWGGVDDTSVTLFDTTSYVTAFDTTIYRWQGSIYVGLDFLSDTPIDFAQFLSSQYGEVMLRDMDEVVATGNGTTQPEGIIHKSGTASVAWGGLTTLGNYESLRFGVHKREHLPNMARTAVFCGTEVSYYRAKAIPVGASDARRLSQTVSMPDYNGYSWMDRPYKINESLSNSEIFYAILGRYRMYRRRGLTIRNSVEGDTLIRRNEMLVVAMARYGGQLERGAAAAVTTTAPA